MSQFQSKLPSLLCIGAGLALASFGYLSLASQNEVRSDRNPFAVQRSAYGKLLARLAETTIDRTWHLGVEQVVPHYMTGHKCGPECAHHESEGAPDEEEEFVYHVGDETADGDSSEGAVARNEAILEAGKGWIQARVVAQYTRTNEHSLSKAHLATVYQDIEAMLLRSFKFDPTHYGAYDSYHLFLTSHEFGGTPTANEQARRVAQVAISAARSEKEDPEPWLTAAAAGMNLYLMDAAPYTIKHEPIPLEILKKYRGLIGHCLQRFAEIQAESEQRGDWQNLSMERQMEIAGRSRFASRGFEQFDAMIARAEARAVPGAKEKDVAGIGEGVEQ